MSFQNRVREVSVRVLSLISPANSNKVIAEILDVWCGTRTRGLPVVYLLSLLFNVRSPEAAVAVVDLGQNLDTARADLPDKVVKIESSAKFCTRQPQESYIRK